ncbi:dimethylarginine dimethylaminohydrolase family protein [Iamia sp.]|uniref:dimethylarginine dimethylaminohydrolase family protein n=1 Tax=Iamia sp. TaxID=2722710 RepID=UPI002C423BAA|nr:arginine deiminase-related protein [Iamia sp.]HXH58076.1 arginine deiminase-related protein [Iamia sp.]
MAAGDLSWGRHFLCCRPTHFGVLYEINPWMHAEVAVDPDRALAQWEGLVATLRRAGATVDEITQDEEVPDLVFTANAGVVSGSTFVPAHFRHPERQPETERFATWFADRGFSVERLPAELGHEGAGDALPFGADDRGSAPVLLSGYRFRSDAAATTPLSVLTGAIVRPLELVDERLYHLDITFCPLDDRCALCAPVGWDRYGTKAIESLVPEPLWLTDTEALSFTANSVVVGTTVVMPEVPPRVGRQLEAWGFDPVAVDVGEFLKAGGACRCLTLALDVDLVAPTGGP